MVLILLSNEMVRWAAATFPLSGYSAAQRRGRLSVEIGGGLLNRSFEAVAE